MSILDAIPVVAEFSASDSHSTEQWCTGLHSGNIGDVIYSLPTCQMLGVNHVILNVCADPAFGGRVLNEQAAKALAPLLLAQEFIRRVSIIKSGVPWEYADPAQLGVDYILDSFRASFTNPRLHLLYAHGVPFNLMVDGAKPWVTLGSDDDQTPAKTQPYIVVGLTSRYRRYDHAYYEYLFRNVPPERVFFVGVGHDQIERRNIGGTAFQTKSFLDLARLLQNAALFIGNPSFAYALAEGLKLNRIVEVPEENNVYPLDGSGSLLHMLAPEAVRAKIFNALQLKDCSNASAPTLLTGYTLANMQHAQLYFDTGPGFNETESIPKPVFRGANRYAFDGFPEGASVRCLRFDPVNDHVIARVNSIKLSGKAGEASLSATPSNALCVNDGQYCFANDDPQYSIDVPEQFRNGIEQIVIDMEVIAIGTDEVARALYPRQIESLVARQRQLDADKDAMAIANQRLLTEQRRLTAERDSLVAGRDQLLAEKNQLSVQRDRLTAERDQLSVQRDRLTAEREQLAAQRAASDEQWNQLLKSRSWRITAPLRWLSRRRT
ncbi:hypothetical protein IAG25_17180 [Caballeronia sp. EK]|uniref:hypothetical protein n=1 Tax=Caballeronia sp. EK TaxID=2767469 RepID=UPI001654F341|nr:hypothetical protein [Caballeronia sp. EK]MBC8638550.1 hypothetical protein [Caballeronia sp. EK]